ncbi:hypothetical protein EVAR_99201_1 [Eumeta japonica]|uniref:FP protein C-terminal domain-containing protein n=1 Tax=Eumeta variegata TaxID=151549 RepID=A0A4C1YPH6_EUMVA|nr:hypothetical protein EVAR_99201_1 [Eumeta japonica]
MHLILSVATKLGVSLDERDVVSVERVGMTRCTDSKNSERPHPLVVRLARRVHRNQLLAAAHMRRSITTAGMGFSSHERRLYVNERLTRFNLQIFHRVRRDSLNANWKYVWTRDGKIYARKGHEAGYRLRIETDI